MKSWVPLVGAACVAVASYAYNARAGYKVTDNVQVGTNSWAWGSMGTARNSTDSNQSIGCSVTINGAGPAYVYCSAQSAAGVYTSCQSYNATYVAIARAVSGDSEVYFTQDGNGTCTYLSITNYSYYAPKNP